LTAGLDLGLTKGERSSCPGRRRRRPSVLDDEEARDQTPPKVEHGCVLAVWTGDTALLDLDALGAEHDHTIAVAEVLLRLLRVALEDVSEVHEVLDHGVLKLLLLRAESG
jgi:hypothetical protein